MKRYSSDAYFPVYRKQHETAADVGRFWAMLMRGIRITDFRTARWSGKENAHE